MIFFIHTRTPIQNPLTILPVVMSDKAFLKTTALVTVVTFVAASAFQMLISKLDSSFPKTDDKKGFNERLVRFFTLPLLAGLSTGASFFALEVLSRSGIDIRQFGY